MKQNETLTDYQLHWIKQGAEAIAERLEYSKKVLKRERNTLTARQAKYDLKHLTNLIK